MRLGEILVLQWSDIDQNKQTININKSYDYISQKVKAPKNATSKRVIYISKSLSLIDILNELKQNNHKFIFAETNNKLPSNNAFNHALRHRLKKLIYLKKVFISTVCVIAMLLIWLLITLIGMKLVNG